MTQEPIQPILKWASHFDLFFFRAFIHVQKLFWLDTHTLIPSSSPHPIPSDGVEQCSWGNYTTFINCASNNILIL